MRFGTMTRRSLAATTVAASALLLGASGAFSWTNSGDISCTSSTGWQVHIYSRTTGYTYDRLTNGSGTFVWDLGYRANSSVDLATGKSNASSVSVSAGTVWSASRACGTA